jgi:uncharacterized protein Yka (UPF0111/DUF47 family)
MAKENNKLIRRAEKAVDGLRDRYPKLSGKEADEVHDKISQLVGLSNQALAGIPRAIEKLEEALDSDRDEEDSS